MNQAIIATRVSVSLGAQTVLEDVDFECAHGEFVAIVGSSGTGKSSFLNAIASLVPHSGKISVAGSVGYVFQSHALFPWMTVRENIAFGLHGKTDIDSRVSSLLERIEMVDLANRYPGQLSGGQIQRVALARSLAPSPAVLLMDEPYAALDQRTRERMQQWLLSVWEGERKSVVFVTHYIEEAAFLADRIVVLRGGRFRESLPVPFSRPRPDSLRFEPAFFQMKQRVLNLMES